MEKETAMNLGENIQYLRKINKITQEELADQMFVSRQTISKWEMNQAYPEIPKLVELADVFHCKVDELLRVNLTERMNVYSDVKITKVPDFTMERYVIISPNPEDDVHAYMEAWAQRSGLLSVTDGKPACIGWDFPFVSAEQQNRYGLRGYVSAYILPDGFVPLCPGVEIVSQKETEYASITIRNPFERAFEYIPTAYKKIMEYLNANGFKQNLSDEYVCCFEYVYQKDDMTYMTVCVAVDALARANLITPIR